MTHSPEKKPIQFIAVAGNMGSGKSTLVEFLTKNYAVTPFFEPNERNPYLSDFYLDMKRWGFHSQIFFLVHKFRLHRQLEKATGTVVLDRTIYEDAEIFATALYQGKKMQKRDFQTYIQLYEEIKGSLRPPDLMIYLHCSMRTLRKRIHLRGRKIEQDIPISYLKKLQKLYDNWIQHYHMSKVLVIDTDKLDYMTDLIHRVDLMSELGHFLQPFS